MFVSKVGKSVKTTDLIVFLSPPLNSVLYFRKTSASKNKIKSHSCPPKVVDVMLFLFFSGCKLNFSWFSDCRDQDSYLKTSPCVPGSCDVHLEEWLRLFMCVRER